MILIDDLIYFHEGIDTTKDILSHIISSDYDIVERISFYR